MVNDPRCQHCDSDDVFWQGTDVRENDRLRASAYQCQNGDCREPFFYDFKAGDYLSYQDWTQLKESVDDDSSKSMYRP